jgi:hypothetical protein
MPTEDFLTNIEIFLLMNFSTLSCNHVHFLFISGNNSSFSVEEETAKHTTSLPLRDKIVEVLCDRCFVEKRDPKEYLWRK